MSAKLIDQIDALADFYRAGARQASLTALDSLTDGARYRLLRTTAHRLDNIGDRLHTGSLGEMAAQTELDDAIELLLDHSSVIPT